MLLLPLSTTAAGAPESCGGCAVCFGYGLPVKSMFLKLSTSSDALLLPAAGAAAPSAEARSSPPARCGSMLASVFAKGFAGTTDGLSAGKLVPDAVLELAMPSPAAIS